MRVVLRATASHVPEREVSSAWLGERLGLSEADILSRTGIATRRWAADGESTSTLAARAARKVLEETGTAPKSVDQVLVSTTSPDMSFPATACLVQQQLGLDRAAAMDVFASCSGFLAALSMARSAILCGAARRILIVCADVKSRFLDLDDPSTAVLFGDGAGAALVEAGGPGLAGADVGPVTLHTDGSRWDWVHLPAGGSRMPISRDTLDAGLHTLKMRGIPLFRMAVTRFAEVVGEVLAREGLDLEDVGCFVFHQANLRILEAAGKRIGIPPKKLVTTLETLGNTSSASLPITLDAAWRGGRIQPGEPVILATFGGGITWGACRIIWDVGGAAGAAGG